MATITLDTKTVQVVEPESYSDSNYEQYEYLLEWYGRHGEPYQYMFKDWNHLVKTNVITANKSDIDKIKSIIASEINTVVLVAENLTPEDYEVVRSITVSNNVKRKFTISSGLDAQKVGVSNHSYEYSNSSQRRNFVITLTEYEKPLFK